MIYGNDDQLTPEQAATIRRLHREGMTIKQLALRYSVPYNRIRLVVSGMTFKHAGDGFVHWDMGDEIACDSIKGDMTRVDTSQHIGDVTCPDCLKILQIIKRGFRAYEAGQYQNISELWEEINDDNK